MSWESLFTVTNAWAMLAWLALAFLPRGPKTLALILYSGVLFLCLTYAVMLGAIMSGVWDAEGPDAPMDFTKLSGVMALFATKGGTVVGWTHYLAFDLFTGLWIARDADNKGFSRIVQFPFLFLTLMVGPVGLAAWLLIREPAARRQSIKA